MSQPQPETSSVRRYVLLAAKISVSIILLIVLFSKIDMAQLWATARLASIPWLLVALVVFALSTLVGVWRWNLLLEAQHVEVHFPALLGSYMVALYFNNFLPSNIGGDLVRVRDSSRLTGCTTTSLAVVAIDRILGIVALYVLAAAAYVAGGPAVRHLAGARSVIAGLGVFFALLAYVFFRPGTARLLMARSGLSSLSWAQQRFETVQAAVHVYRQRLGDVWRAFGASLAIQALFIYYYFAVAHALRIPLSWPACFLMVPLCTLVQTVPVSFNGWGIRESVFILYFGQMGLPRESALAFSVVGAGLIVFLSFSGAVVWTSRSRGLEASATP